jgi:hypothetical protein
MNNSIFRKTSLEKISSPEQLNDYIKVSNPIIWTVLAAIFVLLAAVVVWSITGSLPTSVSTSGIAQDGEIICYLSQEEAAKVRVGMNAQMNGMIGKISSVSDTPLSANEISNAIGSDYNSDALSLSQWNLSVNIAVDGKVINDKIYTVSIVTDEVSPIEFLFN